MNSTIERVYRRFWEDNAALPCQVELVSAEGIDQDIF